VNTSLQAVDTKEVKVRSRSLWRSGAKKNGALEKNTKNAGKLKLLPGSTRRVSNGLSR